MRPMRNAGFSFMELSVVILIIALLAGSIMVGRSLIEQASVRAAIGEVDKIKKSLQVFVDKYGQLPGDFNRAESFWGADDNCPTTAFNTTPKKATCNGDGGGTISTCCSSNTHEVFRMWQHLANAGTFEGAFSGVGGLGTPAQLLGTSVPASAIEGGGYMVLVENVATATAEEFVHGPGHFIEFGAIPPTCSSTGAFADCLTRGRLLVPERAISFDAKIDDGRPGTGTVLARPSTSTINPNCSTADGEYDSETTIAACGLIINTGY